MRLCIVEDSGIDNLSGKLGTRLARSGSPGAVACSARSPRPHLVDLSCQQEPHLVLNDREWLSGGPVLVVNGLWVLLPNSGDSG